MSYYGWFESRFQEFLSIGCVDLNVQRERVRHLAAPVQPTTLEQLLLIGVSRGGAQGARAPPLAG